MDLDLLREQAILAHLELLSHQLRSLIEWQREQNALDESIWRYIHGRSYDKSNDLAPVLPDGELDMMDSIRRGAEELDVLHRMMSSQGNSNQTPGQRSLERRPSFERVRLWHGPQDAERGPQALSSPHLRHLAPSLEANLYLANGHVSHIWPDAHLESFGDELDTNPVPTDERPSQGQEDEDAGPWSSDLDHSFFARSTHADLSRAREASTGSESHLPRLP